MANIVAIVGRPNVGKSTLFNRLVGERKAIMDDESGVTRDRHYGHSMWCGTYFSVIDTGGYVVNSDDVFEEAIRDQVALAIEESDVVLFVVDISEGLTDLDKDFANYLRRHKKTVYVVANKADDPSQHHYIGEFYSLGFDDVFPVSSQTSSGTGDLLDQVITHFEEKGIEDPDEGIPKIAVLGRPNAGKSSFVNTLLGVERNIVTEIAGTTRDSVDSRYSQFGKEFILIDTAGVRRKTKVHEDIEFYSVMRAIRSLEDCDVAIVMVDATRGVESQDMNIIRLALQNNKGIVVLMNKWDLMEKSTNTTRDIEKSIREKLAPNAFIPILFVSALTKQRIFKAIEKAIEVYGSKSTKIPTSSLNDALLPEIGYYPPPAVKGKYIRIKYVTQLPTNSLTFAFFCNLPQYIRDPYRRFLENKIRAHFPLEGVPINIVFRKK